MSKYTTEVRYICETLANITDDSLTDIETIIANSRQKIFNFNYPIFDTNYKSILETKILRHYYTREIAHETVGLWKLKLNTMMNEIMPYYNQLYKSELLTFNPLYNTEITTTKDGNVNKTSSNSESTNHSSNSNASIKTTVNDVINDNGTITENESASNTGTINNSGTTHNTGTIINAGTVSDDGKTTNALKDTTTATNTLDKDFDENKLDTYSDTPQGAITNLENNTYLTNARKNLNSNTEKDTEKINNVLEKTGTVNSDNTTTTDMTQSNNLTNTTDNTQTNNLNSTNDSTRTNNSVTSKTGNEDVTNTNARSGASAVNGSMNATDIESYTEIVKGKQGGESYSELLKKFRETFLNIDMLVIKDLGELFFNLW